MGAGEWGDGADEQEQMSPKISRGPDRAAGVQSSQLLVVSICKEEELRIAWPPPPCGPRVSWESQGSFHTGRQRQREMTGRKETPNSAHLSAPLSRSLPLQRNLLGVARKPHISLHQ